MRNQPEAVIADDADLDALRQQFRANLCGCLLNLGSELHKNHIARRRVVFDHETRDSSDARSQFRAR